MLCLHDLLVTKHLEDLLDIHMIAWQHIPTNAILSTVHYPLAVATPAGIIQNLVPHNLTTS